MKTSWLNPDLFSDDAFLDYRKKAMEPAFGKAKPILSALNVIFSTFKEFVDLVHNNLASMQASTTPNIVCLTIVTKQCDLKKACFCHLQLSEVLLVCVMLLFHRRHVPLIRAIFLFFSAVLQN